jgi:uncharacterized membrane protein
MKEMKKTNELVLTAMFMCLIILAQTFFRLPIPGTSGYVHLADAVIYLAVMYLGHRKGALAAALGSAMGDLLAGYAAWIPWTLVVKGGMALIFGLCMEKHPHGRLLGMILGGVFMTVGYFVAETVMYGNPITATLGIPWNIAQFCVGIIVADCLQHAIKRAKARKSA